MQSPHKDTPRSNTPSRDDTPRLGPAPPSGVCRERHWPTFPHPSPSIAQDPDQSKSHEYDIYPQKLELYRHTVLLDWAPLCHHDLHACFSGQESPSSSILSQRHTPSPQSDERTPMRARGSCVRHLRRDIPHVNEFRSEKTHDVFARSSACREAMSIHQRRSILSTIPSEKYTTTTPPRNPTPRRSRPYSSQDVSPPHSPSTNRSLVHSALSTCERSRSRTLRSSSHIR